MTPVRFALALLACVACTSASTASGPDPASSVDGGSTDAAREAESAAATKCVTTATFTALCAYDPGCATATDFQTDVLPTGACAADDACKPIVRPTSCGCPRVPGPASFYDCVCKSGAWSCTLSSQNAHVCDPACDGGPDAAHD